MPARYTDTRSSTDCMRLKEGRRDPLVICLYCSLDSRTKYIILRLHISPAALL